jgi:DNA polymerase-3 subunit alpha
MPDFDVDFANEGRDEVIKYVTEKYGKERVGQIITFGTLGAKAVIKDVARALSISIPESEMITKLIPKDPKITLEKAFAGEPKLRELETDPRYTELFALARKLEGLNRHSSLHAAGVVIGKSALLNFVPLYRDPKTGGVATQYDMNHLESCGLVKMDFLGLKTLDVIKRTEELIRHRGGGFENFSIEEISEEDEAAFKMLGEGKSFEVFQFESEGMQNVLKQAKPNTIEDLIALNSLYRPGPMDNIPQFIDSKNGRQGITYPDPSLEEALKETYGVIVYQEQVMQVARIIAGYSLGQADLLRRAMGKKKKEILDKEKIPFLAGAAKQGYSEAKAGEIYDLLVPFAGYGFNKSHAAAYSVVAYRTAYLKANFPAEFMAANLTNEIHSADKDKLSKCIDEARKMGLAIDPPDVNRSDKLFSVVDGRIVYGFLGIKGLGDGPADEIVARRQEGGAYKDFIDFLDRVDIKAVGKSVIERLVQTGAFDRFGVSRETLLGNLERAADYAQNKKDEKKFGQSSLFEESGDAEFPDYTFEPFPEMSRMEKLNIEKQLIGFYFSGHPMDEYKSLWERAVKVDLGNPENLALGNHILVGLLKSVKTIITGKGVKMAFAALSDYNGEIEATFFPQIWEQCQDKVAEDQVAILRGKIEYQANKDRHSFLVEDCLSPAAVEGELEREEAQNRKWDKYRNVWKYAGELDLRLLDLSAPGKAEPGTYTVIGFLKSLRLHQDKKGNEMAFATLQDFRGEIDLVFFARTWENCKALAAVDEIVAVKGSIDPAKDRNPDKPGFMVSSIQDLNKLVRGAAKKAAENGGDREEAEAGAPPPPEDSRSPGAGPAANPGGQNPERGPAKEAAPKTGQTKAAAEICRELHLRLREEAAETEAGLSPLRDYLVENPGTCAVFIHVPVGEGERVIRTANQLSVAGDPAHAEALSRCAAVAEVWRR